VPSIRSAKRAESPYHSQSAVSGQPRLLEGTGKATALSIDGQT